MEEFVSAHGLQLQAIGLSSVLWPVLYRKLCAGAIDESVFHVENGKAFYYGKDRADVYLVSHAWVSNGEPQNVLHTELLKSSELRTQLQSIVQPPCPKENGSSGVVHNGIENGESQFASQFWARCGFFETLRLENENSNGTVNSNGKAGDTPTKEPVTRWFLAREPVSWAVHSDSPTFATAPFLDLRSLVTSKDESSFPPSYSLLWALDPSVMAGTVVTVDILRGDQRVRPNTVGRSARLVARLGALPMALGWSDHPTAEKHRTIVTWGAQQPMPGQAPAKMMTPVSPNKDVTRPPVGANGRAVRVFTDYPVVHDWLQTDEAVQSGFEQVMDRTDADVLFLLQHVTNFLQSPPHQLISQYPFEAGLVRKDLLPQTIRRWCSGAGGALPIWYPMTFDLTTELQFFLAEHEKRSQEGTDNLWIIKRAQDTHSRDVHITDSLPYVIRLMEVGSVHGIERVAQKYITNPMLHEGKKFDVRCFVVVRQAFGPLQAFLYMNCIHGRVAPNAFSEDLSTMADANTHLTVHLYGVGQTYLVPSELQSAISKAYKGTKNEDGWTVFLRRLRSLLFQLFHGAGKQMGVWPNCRGLYGIDVLPDAHGHPKLLEVNFCPDFSLPMKYEPHFVRDIMTALLTDQEVPSQFSALTEEIDGIYPISPPTATTLNGLEGDGGGST